ncbi:unnamed protein product [Rotaria socialis]|uniref:NAD(P)(+)--arginine ADP-ribosyltransferase n=1 Tax=Rotaria socialis TaxID=392032 RepID=A0A821CP30_9BILA|nr:unnamed protein product [Rotaria socialis]
MTTVHQLSRFMETKTKVSQINLEDFSVVWLDTNLLITNDCKEMANNLRQIINYLKLFDNTDDCLNYISSLTNEKVFLITSGSLGQVIMPLIDGIPQILSVYIYCTIARRHRQWFDTYSGRKLHGLYTDMNLLLFELKKEVALQSKNLFAISVFNQNISNVFKEKSIQDLGHHNGTFIWFQILIETLLRMRQTNDAKVDMLTECRLLYDGNNIEQDKIYDFKHNYQPSDAIRWYTRDSFAYRLLNKALRTENIDIIFLFRFMIKDLHQQLRQLHEMQMNGNSFTVYRGQQMSNDEFQTIRNCQNGRIATNTYLSTTFDKDVAVIYAGDGSARPEIESILFEITVDNKSLLSLTPYANIGSLSYYQDESEVLFSIGTVFCIVSITEDTNGIWHVKLNLSTDEDKEIRKVVDYFRRKMLKKTTLRDLGDYLKDMGQYDKAISYYRVVLERFTINDENEDILYKNIAKCFEEKGDLDEALKNYLLALEVQMIEYTAWYTETGKTYYFIAGIYEKKGIKTLAMKYMDKAFDYLTSLEKQQSTYKSWDSHLVETCNYIGLIHAKRGNHQEALAYFEKASNKLLELPPNDDNMLDLASTYAHIGAVWSALGNGDSALKYYQESYQLKQKILPSSHPSLGTSFNNMGVVCSQHGNYEDALNYYRKSIELRQKSLPIAHISIAACYANMANLYSKQNDFTEAINHYEKALDIRQSCLSQDSQLITKSYIDIAYNYDKKCDYDKSLEIYRTALSIAMDHKVKDHVQISSIYNRMGLVHQKQGKMTDCFEYHRNALQTYLGNIRENHQCPQYLVVLYENVSFAQMELKLYTDALENCQKALTIRLKNTPDDHLSIAKLCHSLGNVYHAITNYKLALHYYSQSFQIQYERLPSNHTLLETLANKIYKLCVEETALSKFDQLDLMNKVYELLSKLWRPGNSKMIELRNDIEQLEDKLDILTIYWNVDKKKLHKLDLNENSSISNSACSGPTVILKAGAIPAPLNELLQSPNFEGITLIWYDPRLNTTEDTKQTAKELREINNYVIFHSDQLECIDFIKSIKDEKIFLVTSGKAASTLLPEIIELKQVDSIFIFCWKIEKYQDLLQRYESLVGIYTDRSILINAIKENVDLLQKQLNAFSFYNGHEEKAIRDLSQESAEFIWFQLFKDVILRMPTNSNAKEQLIQFCREYYRGNQKEYNNIDEFERSYKKDKCIFWYTRETFLYKLVNKALRTEDMAQLHMFRFFIADLSLHLATLHKKNREKNDVVMLYRGLKMENEELNRFKTS